MNKRVIKHIIFCFFAFTCWSTFSCNDPAAIDTNLVDIDLLDILSESDFDISSYTEVEDSLISYQPGLTILDRYPFGIYQDPVFGTATSSIVSQVFLTTTSPPDFTDAVIDSVVMQMVFSPEEPFYGDSTRMLGIEVYELEESIDAAGNYYSNYQVETSSSSIGTYSGTPNFRDSIPVNIYRADTLALDTIPPAIRFKLDNEYGERIITAGDDLLTSATEFTTVFRGLELRPTEPSAGMVAFNLNAFNSAANPGLNGTTISIFYTVNGNKKQYDIAFNPVRSVKFVKHSHDYAGSPIEDFIGDVTKGDSLTFVQGLSGSNTIIRLDDLSRLDGAIVNGASLEVYATALDNDDDLRPLPAQLVLRENQDNGTLAYTRDFAAAASVGLLSNAGGTPEDMGDGIFKYTFNVGSQIQDIITGDRPNELFIRTSNKVATMRRAVLFGAGHSTYPVKLTVTYTKL